MKSSSFLIILWLLTATGSFCQSIPWERINPNPIESSLKEIVRVPGTNRLVAIGTGATLLYTENMGASWIINYYPAGISRSVNLNAIQFVDSNLGFAAGDHSTLIKTVNGGQSWKAVIDSGDVNFLDVYFIDEQTGFMTKKDSVMKTTDGGLNWVSACIGSSSFYSTPKYLHFINDSTGFIGNTGHLYYRTSNAGATWDSVTITPAIEGFGMRAIQFLDENTGFISGVVDNFSSNTNYILRTSDGGATWQVVYTDPFNYVQNFYFFDAQTGFATGHRVMYDNMILRTVDGGLTWQESNMPYSFLNLTAPSFLENGYGLCVGDYGQILKSNDWGQNWFIRYQWTFHAADINDAQIVDQNTVFIGTSAIGGGGVASGNIYKSTDAGYTWDKMFEANPIYVLQFLNSDFGVAIGNFMGELYKTMDGGASWETLEVSGFNFDARSLWFINEQTGFVGGDEGGNAVIYKTTDSCKTWQKSDVWLHRFDEINNMAFADDSNGFAVSRYIQDYFLRTYNQGDTWVVDSFDVSASVRKIYFINPDTGFAIGNRILKTTNGGNTWETVTHDLEGQYQLTDIDFPTEEVGYITVSENTKTLLRTDDGGDSWYSLDIEFYTTSTPDALAFFSKDVGLVMGENSIVFKTYTGGFVGIDENKSNSTGDAGLTCYPNPVTSSLTIVFPDKNTDWHIVSFCSTAGRLVKKVIMSGYNKNTAINLFDLNTGVYFVVAESSNGNKSSAKIVKL